MIQPHLPGQEPDYVRFDVTRQPRGDYTMRVFVAEAIGFVSAQESDLYTDLVGYEVCDLLAAVAEGLLGLPASEA